VGDKAFLKVSPVKGIRRFNLRGKLNPKYIGPYKILEKLNSVAYRLDLPTELEHVHSIFHISQLRKYVPDLNYTITTEPVEIAENLMYGSIPYKY